MDWVSSICGIFFLEKALGHRLKPYGGAWSWPAQHAVSSRWKHKKTQKRTDSKYRNESMLLWLKYINSSLQFSHDNFDNVMVTMIYLYSGRQLPLGLLGGSKCMYSLTSKCLLVIYSNIMLLCSLLLPLKGLFTLMLPIHQLLAISLWREMKMYFMYKKLWLNSIYFGILQLWFPIRNS